MDIGFSNVFVDLTPKVREPKTKINIGLHQMEKLLHSKGKHDQNEKAGEELQDGRRVRCGDLPTNTSEIHLHVEQLLQNTY